MNNLIKALCAFCRILNSEKFVLITHKKGVASLRTDMNEDELAVSEVIISAKIGGWYA